MIRRILVPLDGSPRAEGVLPYVLTLASVLGARLDLLHVIPGSSRVGSHSVTNPLAYRLAQADRTNYLKGKAAALRESGVEVRTLIHEGGAAEVIVDLLRGASYDLVGLTTHGETFGSALRMGCVAVAVILNAQTSILMAPGKATGALEEAEALEPAVFRSIMAPVDCSPRSDWAVTVAAAIARGAHSDLDLVHVLGRPEMMSRLPESSDAAVLVERILEVNRGEARRYLEQTAWRVRGEDLEVEERLVESVDGTADVLHDLVEAEKPDLVILSAHGRGASPAWPLGGTAAKLIFWSDRPVLILQDLPDEKARPRWAARSGRATSPGP